LFISAARFTLDRSSRKLSQPKPRQILKGGICPIYLASLCKEFARGGTITLEKMADLGAMRGGNGCRLETGIQLCCYGGKRGEGRTVSAPSAADFGALSPAAQIE
jgi:hypothetical protein